MGELNLTRNDNVQPTNERTSPVVDVPLILTRNDLSVVTMATPPAVKPASAPTLKRATTSCYIVYYPGRVMTILDNTCYNNDNTLGY